jgi:2-iminobutanoate/2-iminopropanoate deaminase
MAELKRVHSDGAPAAIGPYSQAVITGNMVYSAGQIALDPTTMQIVGSNVAEQTERVLQNLRAVLAEAGSSLDRVVKTLVFLADMDDFAAMNEVYGRHFGDHKPARSTVQAAKLPKSALVEIEVVAVIG